MSIVGIATAVGAAVSIGSKAYSGYKAGQVDTSGAVGAAKELSMAEQAQMGQESSLKLRQISEKTNSMMEAATAKGQKSMMQVASAQDKLGRTGFEQSDAGQSSLDRLKSSVYKDYNRQVDKIMVDDEISKQSISLSQQRQSGDIEKRLQSNITQATATPDSFWEGFVGQGDYKVG